MDMFQSKYSNEISSIISDRIVLWINKAFSPEIAEIIQILFNNAMNKLKIVKCIVENKDNLNNGIPFDFSITKDNLFNDESFEAYSIWINAIFLAFRNPDHQSTIGQVFTPFSIVKQINERILEFNQKNGNNNQKLENICDFACGPGHFINYLLWKSLESGRLEENLFQTFNQLKANLYAYDIDPAACFATFATATLLSLIKLHQYHLSSEIQQLIDINILPPIEILNQDFLQPNLLSEKPYNLIIGNRPYIFSRDLPEPYRQQLIKWNYNTATGQYDLSDVFIERAIEQLIPGGHLGIIIPEAIQSLENRKTIRLKIVKNASRIELSHVKTPFYQKSVSNLILFLEKAPFSELEKNKIQKVTLLIDNESPKEYDYQSLLLVSNHTLIPQSSSLQDALQWIKQNYISIEEWNANHPEDPFILFRGVELSKKGVVMQCPNCLKWMPFSAKRNTCTHCNQNIPKSEIKKHSILHKIDENTSNTDTNHPYFLDSFGNIESEPKNKAKTQNRAKPLYRIDLTYQGIQYKNIENYNRPRILVRQLLQKGQICSIISPTNCFTSQSIYNILPPSRFSEQLELLLNWIQTPHVSFYNFHTFSKGKDLFARILLGKLKQLPWIPRNLENIPNIPPKILKIINS